MEHCHSVLTFSTIFPKICGRVTASLKVLGESFSIQYEKPDGIAVGLSVDAFLTGLTFAYAGLKIYI